MHRFLRSVCASVLLLFLLCTVQAGSFRAVGTVLVVNGKPVFQIKASAGGISGAERTALVARTLAHLSRYGPIETKRNGTDFVILIDSCHCLTVTPADASRSKTTPALLAESWAAKLNQALLLPPLTLSQKELQLPVGADKLVRIMGGLADQAAISASPARILRVTRTDDGVSVHGVGSGSGTVTVNADGHILHVNVAVRPWAADFPQSCTAEVAGIPTAGATVRGAIAMALKGQLVGVPGTDFQYKLPDCGALGTGESRSYAVHVRALASHAYSNYGVVNVQVKNVPIVQQADSELWYSNNPEVVTKPMSLFSASLRMGAPARLLYHHINGSSQPIYIRVQAVNNSDIPAKVIVIPGDSKPDYNPVRAGIVAADEYFRAWIVGSGEIVSIPAHSTMPISLRRLSPNETDSGLCGLRLIAGPKDLLVRTDSFPPFQLDPAWKNAIRSSTPWREVGCHPLNDYDKAPYVMSEHIYPDPRRQEEVSYKVGGRFGYLRIGQRAILRQDGVSQLDGNFGVIYNIKASISNPTNETTDVEIVFEASAGYSGGLFCLNGSFIHTPLLQPKEVRRLAKFHMTPGSTQSVDITTLPLSGSSYPATMLIRPVAR